MHLDGLYRRYNTVVGKYVPEVYSGGTRYEMLVMVMDELATLVMSKSIPPLAEEGCEGQV
jgi:hypothetical protein